MELIWLLITSPISTRHTVEFVAYTGTGTSFVLSNMRKRTSLESFIIVSVLLRPGVYLVAYFVKSALFLVGLKFYRCLIFISYLVYTFMLKSFFVRFDMAFGPFRG